MNILISGYYGFDNAGDEWLLETTLTVLRAQHHQLTVLSDKPERTKTRHHVDSLSRWKPIGFYKALKKNDCLLFGGGGLIQDLSGFKSPLYYLLQLLAAKWLKKKVVMLGQGFGPVNRKFNQWLCELILPIADLVIVRDSESYWWCRSVGLDDSKLYQAADLVWLKSFDFKAGGRKHWLVCLRADRLDDDTLPQWVINLKQRAEKEKKQLAFIAIGNGGDEALLEKVRQHRALGSCMIYKKNEIEEAFGKAILVISMRYHGLLLGALAGCPVIGVGQDPKIESLVNLLHQRMATGYNMEDMVLLVTRDYAGYQNEIKKMAKEQHKTAAKMILRLQTFLLNS